MINIDVPGYVVAILWVALAFSVFANIILFKEKFLGRARKEPQRKG